MNWAKMEGDVGHVDIGMVKVATNAEQTLDISCLLGTHLVQMIIAMTADVSDGFSASPSK
jgi:hypothetical protein